MNQLPAIEYPTHTFTIPSTKQVIEFRPLIAKDKKLLLIAMETKEFKEIVKAVKQIMKNCVLTPGFDPNKLASFDVEMFFLTLHAKSDSEITEASFRCQNPVNGKPCNQSIDIKTNLMEIKLTEFPDHEPKIQVTDKVGIVMKYPTFEMLESSYTKNSDTITIAYEFLLGCIDYIYDKDQIYSAAEVSKEVLEDFVDKIPAGAFQKMEHFVATMPVLRNVVHHECPKCHYVHEHVQEGLESFFG